MTDEVTHDMKEMALEFAVTGMEFLARWLVSKRSLHKPKALYNMADALEHCWKIRAGISPKSHSGYPDAAEAVGLATSRRTASGRWFDYKDPALEQLMIVRNERHGEFVDRLTDPAIWQALGHLLAEIELAVGKRLELAIPREHWQVVLAQPRAARALEVAILDRLRKKKTGFTYIRCPRCGHETFDSLRDYCRLCFHKSVTFLCVACGYAHWHDDKMRYIPRLGDQQTRNVCRNCFRQRGQERETALSSSEAFPHIAKCQACSMQCLDIDTARCLLCGQEQETLSAQEASRRALKRCRACRRLFHRTPSRDRCCPKCAVVRLKCIACEYGFRPDYLVKIGENSYCRPCAKALARCTLCHKYSDTLVERALPIARESAGGILIGRKFDPPLWSIEPQFCEKCEALIDAANELLDNARKMVYRLAKRRHTPPRQIMSLVKETARNMGPEIPWSRLTNEMLGMHHDLLGSLG